MKTLGKLILSAGVVFFANHSPAMADSYDLITLYKSAINYDADTAAAKSAYLADQQGEDIALAGLLPNLSASAQAGRIDDEAKSGPVTSDSYKSSQYGLSLSQPLFSMPEWYSLSAAEYSSARAEAVYLAAQQTLILNVAEAYFNVLRAQEDLTASRALETAVKRQYEQAKEQFEVGLIAITDVHEAKASFDSSQTTRIRAEGALTIATESLSRITGEYATELETLREDYPIKIDPTASIESWVNSARESNLNIIIAEFTQKSIEADYKRRRAGHYPTLTLTAGYEDSELENYKPGDRESEQTNVFLNFNLPLYSGGGTQASTRQARYLVEQAKHNLTSAQRAAEIATRSEYINIRTNVQTVESLQQNIVSRQSALEATREGYNVGTRNIVEVLDAERNYFTALRDYASARFDFVISTLKIKQAAGLLSEQDLVAINEFLDARVK
jgi:outer membrane protein